MRGFHFLLFKRGCVTKIAQKHGLVRQYLTVNYGKGLIFELAIKFIYCENG